LERNVPINREKHVEPTRGDLQERTVLHAGPTFILGGPNFVIR
jgi:hypothetical protein